MEYEGSELFAVIKTGGKQYSVSAGDTITVMTLSGEPGDSVAFDHVLMLSGDGDPALGTPFIEGASVAGQIVKQTRRRLPSRSAGGRTPSVNVDTARI